MYYVVFLFLTSCVPTLIVGSGVVVGGMSLREKGISGFIDDASISAKVRSNLFRKDSKWHTGMANKIGVSVQNGEVLLTGSVDSVEEAMWAEQAVWEVFGVRQVVNQLRIKEPVSWGASMKDSLITTKVKASIMANSGVNFRSLNYVVKTVGGIVYIMGISRDRREQNAVLYSAARVKGVKKVVCLARFKEEVY